MGRLGGIADRLMGSSRDRSAIFLVSSLFLFFWLSISIVWISQSMVLQVGSSLRDVFGVA